jgi:hypothetical protein
MVVTQSFPRWPFMATSEWERKRALAVAADIVSRHQD